MVTKYGLDRVLRISATPTAWPEPEADALADPVDPVDPVEGALLDELDELQAARPTAAHNAVAAMNAAR